MLSSPRTHDNVHPHMRPTPHHAVSNLQLLHYTPATELQFCIFEPLREGAGADMCCSSVLYTINDQGWRRQSDLGLGACREGAAPAPNQPLHGPALAWGCLPMFTFLIF